MICVFPFSMLESTTGLLQGARRRMSRGGAADYRQVSEVDTDFTVEE